MGNIFFGSNFHIILNRNTTLLHISCCNHTVKKINFIHWTIDKLQYYFHCKMWLGFLSLCKIIMEQF